MALDITTSLDQSLPVDDTWILERVEEIIQESVEKADVYIALDACKSILQVAKLSGLALAKALYLIQQNWEAYHMEESFRDIVFVYIGLTAATVDRYVRVQAMLEDAPEQFLPSLSQQNIKNLIPIANAIAQGYPIEEDTWKELADAPDHSTVSKIIREEKGKAPRKSSLQIVIDEEGNLWAYKEHRRVYVGHLEIIINDEIVQQAIERIIKNSGIIK